MGDRDMRFEAVVLLRAGAEDALEQQRITRGARRFDGLLRGLAALRERRDRTAQVAAPRGGRVSAFAGKIAAKTGDFAGNENSIGGQWLKVHGVKHARLMRIGCRIRGINPAILTRLQSLRVVLRGGPPPAIESRKRDAPPAQPVVTNRFSCLYAHDHCGILFDLADLTELDVFRETGHERGVEAGAAEIPGAETRKKEKQHAT